MQVKPAAGRPLVLRAFIAHEDETLSETWTYHLPPENDILQASQ
jgi:glucan biosynthesis protein